MSVLLGADDHDEEGEAPTWRLIVIEDADELLRADAKRETGQSLSRLLNLADGFIGRGLRTLIMITTNEPLGRLHPAVVRPGRCLAEIEFPLLGREEAAALLDPGQDVDRELSLAEVFERRGDVTRLSSRAPEGSTGQYL
jgi:SpoVK/Ycf46/Vps4 family AAA+-type ATPase